ncbi:MAG: hypothetical protein M0Q12_13530 [Synergistaceae bacterium]|jgi:hypothetical protein|nr:hypothetical protein [Synergistaceae bacterium]
MATTDNENILMMFEEINQKLDKTHLQIEKIGKQPSNETIEIDNDELIDEIRQVKTFIEVLNNEQSDRLSKLETVLRKEKRRIDFSPTSINTMLIVLGFMVIILGLTLWVTSLKVEKEMYSDNDLKYRYFLMIGHATQEEMATMDTIFYFHRNNRKIKELRKQVEIFEKNVKQRARIIEQEERLKREREELNMKIEHK